MFDESTEQVLIEQLGSDKRSLRLQAIVKLTREGKSQSALEALSLLVSNGDREESFFASQAVAKISQKLGVSANNYIPINSKSYNYSDKKQITSDDFLSASRDKVVELLQYVRTKFQEIPEDVKPSVGVFLTKYGDKTDLPFIVNYLQTHSDNLVIPYIAAAEKIDSKSIIPVLPYLLASKEALVRSRAVMVLRKIDSAEAERHFLRLLSSKQAEDRLAALEISFLFPFEHVKDYIIALISEEKDSYVFKACATVLASNPSLELTLRILDVLEAAPAEQKKPITALFNIVSYAIKSARILPPDEATPQALLVSWKKHRLKKFLNDLEIQLSTTTGSKREGIISWIEKNRKIPEVAELIEHLSLNPQTEDVYQRFNYPNPNNNLVLPEIKSIFEKTESAKSATPINISDKHNSSDFEQNDFQEDNPDNQNTSLPELTEVNESSNVIVTNATQKDVSDLEKEQILYFKQLDMQEFLSKKHEIMDMAEDDSLSPSVRAEAMNALLRLSPSSKIKNLGMKALEEDNIKLRTVGFKILERVAPDVLKMKLSSLLLSDDTNIRVRAIRFGLKIDQEKSIESLNNLISSEDQNQRSYAVSCLALCPFEAVYHILIEALRKEKHPLVAKQITAVLLSNPDQVILNTLDKLCVVIKEPNLEMIVSQARNELEEILTAMRGSLEHSNLKEIDVFDKTEHQEEDKPYSVENVRKLSNKDIQKKNTKDTKKSSNSFDDLLASPALLISIILAIVIIVGGMGYGVYSIIKNANDETKYNTKNKNKESSNNRSSNFGKNSKSSSSSKFKKNNTYNIKGKITNIISDSNFVMTYDNREIMVKFTGKEAKGLKKGDVVEVEFVPYRENPNGIILTNGKKLSKVNQE